MIEATPKHWFSNDFVLRSSNAALAVLDVSGWRERAEFEIDGVAYRLYREGLVSGAFVLERPDGIVARAFKPSALRDRFEIELKGTTYTLRKVSRSTRRFGVFVGDQQVGSVARVSLFSQRAVVELPSSWTVALQIYAFWLVLLIWNRKAAADAG